MGIKIVVRRNENAESMVRRFKRLVERSDVLKDHKKHSVYEKPSEKKKRKDIEWKKNYKRYIRDLHNPSTESLDSNDFSSI